MSIDIINNHFDSIDKLLLSPTTSLNDIKGYVDNINQFPILTFKIPPLTRVYRTRYSFDSNYFNLISDLSYPPKHKVKSYGRFNAVEQSMFYCSEDLGTSYLETINYLVKNIKQGDLFYITVGEWEIQKEIQALVIANPNKAERYTRFEINTGNAYDLKLGGLSGEQKEIAELVYKKLYSYFSYSAKIGNSIYWITSLFSNKLFNAFKNLPFQVESVAYPSVASFEEGINFAFAPLMIDNNFILPKMVWRIKLIADQGENGFFNFKEIERAEGKIIGEKIKWNE